MEERIRGGENRVFGCLKATCCSDPDSPEGKCRLPTPKRAVKPVTYKRFELLECFPYYFEGTWLLDKFACIKWLVRYNPRWLLADIIAGLTVGLMVVPQALAYATIARLPHSVSVFILIVHTAHDCIQHGCALVSCPAPFTERGRGLDKRV